MPFGLKLKKSKNYSVVSKSLCVIIVKLLENGTVECILSSRTLGQECLENVCQRLQISQTEYFGLRYVTKDGTQRWVDLDRPLKKQLDKYAQEFSLTLGIMFYVFNVDNLSDELTRYYYFSHLKSDVLEGRLRCTREEAVQLASYSLQAEFGDHRPEHHTPDYLKNFVLVPKYLTGVAGGSQDLLLEEIIKAHQSLLGTPHAVAEIYYLIAVQRLEGYGEELFYVKDHLGQDVTLGVSALGVTVRYPSRIHEHSMAYQWSEIVDLIHHKKFFKIEGRDANCCAQFQLDDVITAKYIWKQCVQQHKFYMQMKQVEGSRKEKEVIKNLHAATDTASRPPVLLNNNNTISNNSSSSSSSNNYANIHTLQNSYSNSSSSAAARHDPNNVSMMNQPHAATRSSTSMGSLDDLDSGVYHTETQSASHIASPPVAAAHKEEPDYENVSMLLANSHEMRRALLPEYRRAPDYEQAIRMKYQISASLNDLSYGPQNHYHQNRLSNNYASSIPSSNIDISATSKSYNPLMPLNSYTQYGHYSDLQAIGNSSQELIHSKNISKTSPALAFQGMLTSSTPELSIEHQRALAQSRDFYPIQARVVVTSAPSKTSTSVPDLTQSSMSHSVQTTPDVISNPGEDPALRNSSGSVTSVPSNRGRPISSTSAVTVNNQRVSYTEENVTKVNVTNPPPVEGSESSSHSSNMLAGPMLLAAMNGLAGPTVKPDILEHVNSGIIERTNEPPKDSRIQDLEAKLAGGHVFQEYEQIVKKKPMANFATAMLAENMPRNRFKDVLPYEENRVRLGPSKDNRTGYINASHVSISIGEMHRFYIAAQGPMANTCFHFWQMIWENNVAIIVMLTDVVENGKEKCHPYWPQADDSRVTFKDFVITRKTTCVSSTFTTCALQVQYLPTRVTRSVYHLQYTDWPDHGCPMDIHGFLSFMEEIESVRRLVLSEQNLAQNRAVRNAPVVMHCTAGVGRSGVVILCDLLLFCLDHNHPIDVPQALTYIRYQRMLSVQTLAQYKFVYQVLIQYLKNSRLI